MTEVNLDIDKTQIMIIIIITTKIMITTMIILIIMTVETRATTGTSIVKNCGNNVNFTVTLMCYCINYQFIVQMRDNFL